MEWRKSPVDNVNEIKWHIHYDNIMHRMDMTNMTCERGCFHLMKTCSLNKILERYTQHILYEYIFSKPGYNHITTWWIGYNLSLRIPNISSSIVILLPIISLFNTNTSSELQFNLNIEHFEQSFSYDHLLASTTSTVENLEYFKMIISSSWFYIKISYSIYSKSF